MDAISAVLSAVQPNRDSQNNLCAQAEFFDKLEAVARAVREDDRPFGGIQLVLCGDFLQLPPVSRGGEKGFCFEAQSWWRCFARQDCVELSRTFRQTEARFISMLGELRRGDCSEAATARLRAAQGEGWAEDGIKPTRLHTHKHSLERVNAAGLAALPGAEVVFAAADSGSAAGSKLLEALRADCAAQETLTLKVSHPTHLSCV